MNLLLNPQHGAAETLDTARAPEPLQYVRFRQRNLAKDDAFGENSGDQELCLVLLSGKATIHCGDQVFEDIGQRMSVFEQVPPYAVYLPNDTDYRIEAHTHVELGICGAPGYGQHAPRLIEPGQIKQATRGEGANVRHVHDILPETEPADSLLVVEVYTPAGNWSSYPPHKHDQDNLPYESFLEESYYHRLNPSQGFGFQRVYTPDRSLDEAMAFGDGSSVVVPRGYHPVGAPYGFDLYYLNVMAGPKREWKFTTDPDFSWLVG
ncbi:5-deoxy-glucuronate isomerase [Salinisphaera sp. USBA-960]|uniref:5-deoxy-glucuronate isomerase n=1 Tax=Salinisphaera orenii TaxID=856731 RepID=UPI000DBE026A|nr:5-deoxy-glucuronate isomerase [Salifodinibacter halophilus]NNC25657.1 5-deoxy-glucuronate isomerase [Salifodinibacter halophilus]